MVNLLGLEQCKLYCADILAVLTYAFSKDSIGLVDGINMRIAIFVNVGESNRITGIQCFLISNIVFKLIILLIISKAVFSYALHKLCLADICCDALVGVDNRTVLDISIIKSALNYIIHALNHIVEFQINVLLSYESSSAIFFKRITRECYMISVQIWFFIKCKTTVLCFLVILDIILICFIIDFFIKVETLVGVYINIVGNIYIVAVIIYSIICFCQILEAQSYLIFFDKGNDFVFTESCLIVNGHCALVLEIFIITLCIRILFKNKRSIVLVGFELLIGIDSYNISGGYFSNITYNRIVFTFYKTTG